MLPSAVLQTFLALTLVDRASIGVVRNTQDSQDRVTLAAATSLYVVLKVEQPVRLVSV